MKRKLSYRLLSTLLLLCSAGCGGRPTKITRLLTFDVRVETPSGMSHGVSQITTTEVSYQAYSWCLSGILYCSAPNEFHVSGNAPRLWLGNGKVLYVLLSGRNQKDWLLENIKYFKEDYRTNKLEVRVDSDGSKFKDLDGGGYSDVPQETELPYFLYINYAASSSARIVDPYNLRAALGNGYRLKSVSVSSYQLSPPEPPISNENTHPCPVAMTIIGKLPPEVDCQSMRRSN